MLRFPAPAQLASQSSALMSSLATTTRSRSAECCQPGEPDAYRTSAAVVPSRYSAYTSIVNRTRGRVHVPFKRQQLDSGGSLRKQSGRMSAGVGGHSRGLVALTRSFSYSARIQPTLRAMSCHPSLLE